MFSITGAKASAKLGVSPTRVRQLIRSGVLAAEQVAGIWLIDEKSVEARREHNPGRGRPSARRSQPNASRYLLMNRDHEVLAFRFDASTGEFLDADEIIDAKRAPLSIMSPRGTKASKTALSYWWCHRAIPKARHGIEAKLVELGIADTYDLPFKSMGLSLSDQYWIKPYGSEIRWSDVNYFENDFSEAPVEEWMADVGLDSPDNTSDGVLSKRYRHYVECCAALGVEDIETALGKMILCDDIMANTDRHWRNFGLIRDVETLEYRAAPLFDTGSSLWCRVPTRELAYTPFVVNMRPFYEDADRQLRLIGDTSWLDLDKLAGFPEWASDFLDENPSMYDRTDFIYEGLQKRIDFLHLLFG